MILVKENKKKGRKVYALEDRFRKVWAVVNETKLKRQVTIMNRILPGYILDWGVEETTQFIDVIKVPGITANKFEHTPEFIKKVHEFCLHNIKETYPYAHFDWVLSNILVDGDTMHMIDWDNVNRYTRAQSKHKLNSDLKKSFGEKYKVHKRKLKESLPRSN